MRDIGLRIWTVVSTLFCREALLTDAITLCHFQAMDGYRNPLQPVCRFRRFRLCWS